MKDGNDRRIYPRAPLKEGTLQATGLELRVAGMVHPVTRLVDVTPGGIGMDSPAPLQKGTAVSVVTTGASAVQVHGAVAWCKAHAPESASGYRIGVILDKGNLSRNLDFFVALGKINIELK